MNFHERCSDDVYEICWVWKGHFSSVFVSIPYLDGWSSPHQNLLESHMWQSRVEIEHYSVAYFARIAAVEAL